MRESAGGEGCEEAREKKMIAKELISELEKILKSMQRRRSSFSRTSPIGRFFAYRVRSVFGRCGSRSFMHVRKLRGNTTLGPWFPTSG
jgi:hypothetical protein